mgnify:CR=1 FL=1
MNFEKLQNQFLLLDTSFVISFGRYKKFYAPLIDEIFKSDVQVLINDVVRFELTAFARNENEKKDVQDLIEHLSQGKVEDSLLNFDRSNFDRAASLAQAYTKNGTPFKEGMMGDLLIGADLLKYKDSSVNVFLATENNKDFPTKVFERVGVEAIDCGNEINVVGFYHLGD